jgi:hypothetical protein
MSRHDENSRKATNDPNASHVERTSEHVLESEFGRKNAGDLRLYNVAGFARTNQLPATVFSAQPSGRKIASFSSGWPMSRESGSLSSLNGFVKRQSGSPEHCGLRLPTNAVTAHVPRASFCARIRTLFRKISLFSHFESATGQPWGMAKKREWLRGESLEMSAI